jgi:hypothetical protein
MPELGNNGVSAKTNSETQSPAEFQQQHVQPFSAFGSISQFKDAQRMAIMLANSSIVPEIYRGEEHIGNCVIALEIANRIGASVLAVMQNLCMVQGKPGWSSQFLISCVNATRRFSPIRYRMTGTPGEDSWGCIAWALDKTGELLISPEVTIRMAKEEGWYYRNGAKWKTMPELMLYYRSATLFARLFAPEITMGLQTTDEVVDIGAAVNAEPCRPVFETSAYKSKPKPEFKVQLKAENTGGIAESKRKKRAALGVKGSLATARDGPNGNGRHDYDYDYAKALKALITLSNHSEAEVLTFLHKSRRCDPSITSLAEVANQQPAVIIWAHENWKSVQRELSRLERKKTR